MIKIGKPFTPSTIIDTKEIKMTEIMISCGGGMGGSRWEVYTKDNFDLNDKFITVDTNEDKHTVINTNFIVQTRPVRFLKMALRNDGNPYMKHEVGKVEDMYFLIPEGESIVVDPNSTDGRDLKRIEFAK